MDTSNTTSMSADIATQLVKAKTTLEKWRDYCTARIRVCEITGCWIWTGAFRLSSKKQKTVIDRRPVLSVEGKRVYAYRVVWALRHDQPFPADKLALHKCDRPECVNPDHIRPGTAKDNAHDAAVRGRCRARLTDDQVRTIMAVSARMPGAGLHQIAVATGDKTIKRWNVRDVLVNSCGVARVSARVANKMTTSHALGL